jgi:hypothetical protein
MAVSSKTEPMRLLAGLPPAIVGCCFELAAAAFEFVEFGGWDELVQGYSGWGWEVQGQWGAGSE